MGSITDLFAAVPVSDLDASIEWFPDGNAIALAEPPDATNA